PGERVAALPANRVVFRDGVMVATQTGGEVQLAAGVDGPLEWQVRELLAGGANAAAMLAPPPLTV
ncbi:MAG: hypothetical protein AAGD86_02150, partial [Pseudomonadota bacterium]